MTNLKFENTLKINRCPHCNVDNPNILKINTFKTQNSEGKFIRIWINYACQRCGGVITASVLENNTKYIHELFPAQEIVSENIPERARIFLQQAIESIHAPSGSIMLSASSVDAMLKKMNYKKGSLYSRIDKAADEGLITKEMAKWAHQVRLDANEQRHADEEYNLPDEDDAKKSIEFVKALGLFIFELPELVNKGIENSK